MKIDIAKIKKHILLNIPYTFIFWIANKLGMAYRIAEGDKVVDKLIGAISTLGTAMSAGLLSFDHFDLLIGLVGAGGFYAFMYFKKKNAKKYRKDVEYGSARWGTPKDIKPYVDPKAENNVILTATESLTMNSRPKQLKYARNKNVLVIGGSGSGKTRFFVKPQLMQMHSSYVVTDPKAQILIECGKMLKDNGYKIKVLNTIDFKRSMHYNPFVYIKSEVDILKLVTALIANTKGNGKSNDDFWEKAEVLLYQALIGYIFFEGSPEEQNMNTLVEMIGSMEIREEDETFKNSVDHLFETLEEREANHFAVRQYRKFKLAAGVVCSKRLINHELSRFFSWLMSRSLRVYFFGGQHNEERKNNTDV